MNDEMTQSQDVFPQVRIKSPVMEAWFNSLADIAVSLRLQKQLKIVDMEQDHAFLEDSGNLTMSTTVDGETVCMVVPNEMWSFYGN